MTPTHNPQDSQAAKRTLTSSEMKRIAKRVASAWLASDVDSCELPYGSCGLPTEPEGKGWEDIERRVRDELIASLLRWLGHEQPEKKAMSKDELIEEAKTLIMLIAMEFKTDLRSVQCFDLRVVDRTTELADKIRAGEL